VTDPVEWSGGAFSYLSARVSLAVRAQKPLPNMIESTYKLLNHILAPFWPPEGGENALKYNPLVRRKSLQGGCHDVQLAYVNRLEWGQLSRTIVIALETLLCFYRFRLTSKASSELQDLELQDRQLTNNLI